MPFASTFTERATLHTLSEPSHEIPAVDFPIRDRKVILHVRRRRWLAKDGVIAF